jgi:hypothetical protein
MLRTLIDTIVSFQFEITRRFYMPFSTAIMQAFRDIIQWFLDHLAWFTAPAPVPTPEDCDRPNDDLSTECSSELTERVVSTVSQSTSAVPVDAAALPAESPQPPPAVATSSDALARVSALSSLARDPLTTHEDPAYCRGFLVQEGDVSILANVEADKPSAGTATTEAPPSDAAQLSAREECEMTVIITYCLSEMIARVIEGQSNDSLPDHQRQEAAGKKYQPMPFATWEERQQQDREEMAEFEYQEAAAKAQLDSGDIEEEVEFSETEEKAVATALEEVEENASSLESAEIAANAQSGGLTAPVSIIPATESSASNASSINGEGVVDIAPSSPIHRARTNRPTGARNGGLRADNAASVMGPRAMIKALEDGWKIAYRANTETRSSAKTSEKPSKKKERKSVVVSSTACSRARAMPSRKAGIKAGRAGVKQALQWK